MKASDKPKARSGRIDDVPGLAVRRIAADMVDGVIRRRRPLDELLDTTGEFAALEERDRALARALVGTVLRRLGTLRHLLGLLLDRGPPPQAPRVETALLLGAAQILFLNVPDHAAVDLSVRLVRADRQALHFAGLVNAVLRRVTREGAALLAVARHGGSRYARLAVGAVDRDLRRRRPRTPLPRRTATNPRST